MHFAWVSEILQEYLSDPALDSCCISSHEKEFTVFETVCLGSLCYTNYSKQYSNHEFTHVLQLSCGVGWYMENQTPT